MNSKIELDIPIIILAGGFGTRLKNVLNGLPKPLADINGTPFLKILLLQWIESGCKNFIFSLHYQSQKIIDYIESNKSGFLKNCNIHYVIEEMPLGTGGAVKNTLSCLKIKGEFIVLNADTWLEIGHSALIFTKSNSIAVVKKVDSSRFGSVHFDENKMITKFEEKKANNFSGFINAGIYKLNSYIFENFKKDIFSIETDLFPIMLNINKLNAIILETNFIDIGIPEDYNKFCKLYT